MVFDDCSEGRRFHSAGPSPPGHSRPLGSGPVGPTRFSGLAVALARGVPPRSGAGTWIAHVPELLHGRDRQGIDPVVQSVVRMSPDPMPRHLVTAGRLVEGAPEFLVL